MHAGAFRHARLDFHSPQAPNLAKTNVFDSFGIYFFIFFLDFDPLPAPPYSKVHSIPVGSLELGFLELGFSLRNKYKQQTKETLNVESGVLVAKCL